MKTTYQSDYPAKAKAFAKKGMIDREIAKALGVNPDTFYEWQKKHPDFAEAIKEGKKRPNKEIEAMIYKTAMGLCETEEVIAVPMGPGPDAKARVVRIIRKKIPPNVVAQIFWAKNRMRGRWRDVRDVNTTVSKGLPQVPTALTPEELERVKGNMKNLMPELFNGKHAGKN